MFCTKSIVHDTWLAHFHVGSRILPQDFGLAAWQYTMKGIRTGSPDSLYAPEVVS